MTPFDCPDEKYESKGLPKRSTSALSCNGIPCDKKGGEAYEQRMQIQSATMDLFGVIAAASTILEPL